MKFDVRGMTCGHCVTAISRAVDLLGGNASVDLPAGQVTVSGLDDMEAARQAIEGAQFGAVVVETPVGHHPGMAPSIGRIVVQVGSHDHQVRQRLLAPRSLPGHLLQQPLGFRHVTEEDSQREVVLE